MDRYCIKIAEGEYRELLRGRTFAFPGGGGSGVGPEVMDEAERAKHGVFKLVVESEPTGAVKNVQPSHTDDGTTATLGWSFEVDTERQLELAARGAIDAAASSGQSSGIPVTIPAGSTIDFAPITEPRTVYVNLVHPQLGDSYWPTNRNLFDARQNGKMEEIIEYDAADEDGNHLRFGILGKYVHSLMSVIAKVGSVRRTQWLNLERLYELGQYQTVIDAITDGASAPEPSPVSLVQDPPEPPEPVEQPTPWGPPTNVRVEGTTAKWAPVSKAVKYEISYSLDGGQNWQPRISDITETQFTPSEGDIPDGSTVVFGVQAIDAADAASGWSADVTV